MKKNNKKMFILIFTILNIIQIIFVPQLVLYARAESEFFRETTDQIELCDEARNNAVTRTEEYAQDTQYTEVTYGHTPPNPAQQTPGSWVVQAIHDSNGDGIADYVNLNTFEYSGCNGGSGATIGTWTLNRETNTWEYIAPQTTSTTNPYGYIMGLLITLFIVTLVTATLILVGGGDAGNSCHTVNTILGPTVFCM